MFVTPKLNREYNITLTNILSMGLTLDSRDMSNQKRLEGGFIVIQIQPTQESRHQMD